MKKRTKESSKRVNSLILLIAFTAIMLIVSTYAWFTSQKDITLSNIRGTVEVVENMEISLDAKTWSQHIDLEEAADVFEEAQNSRLGAFSGSDTDIEAAAAVLPEQLFPVSSIGEIGEAFMPLYAGELGGKKLTGIAKVDEVPATGFISFDMYIKNTSRDGADDVLQLNLNSSAQVITEEISKTITDVTGNVVDRVYKPDAAAGLQNTIRVALARYGGVVSSTATQLETLTASKVATVDNVAIWEPNHKDHIETVIENFASLIVDGTDPVIGIEDGVDSPTYALSSTSTEGTAEVENIYNRADTKLTLQKTFKTDNNLENADEDKRNYRILSADELPLDIKNTDEQDFIIQSNKITRYRVYIWLEGQDIDCINQASMGGGIEIDLGLTKDDFVGDVLDTTP